MSNCLNGNLQGSLSVGQGERGKSLEFIWQGTSLGIRVEGQEEYQFTDLGIEGTNGKEVQLQVSNGYIQWKYVDEEEWKNLIAISDLKGDRGLDGKSAYDLWIEQGNEGTVEDFLSSLKGKDGEKGEQGDTGEQGLPGQDGADGKDGITPNIQIGTVTTLEPGENATVENVGTKEEPVFNFGIPRGDKGEDGVGGDSGELKSHINTVILEEPVNTIKINSDKNNVSFAELNITSISMLITANYETSGFNYAAMYINGKGIIMGQNMALYAKDGVYKIDFSLNDDGTANVTCQQGQYGKAPTTISVGIPFDTNYEPVVFGEKIETIELKHAGSSNLAVGSKFIIYGR